MYSLEEYGVVEDVVRDMQKSSGITYDPIDSNWVRLGADSVFDGEVESSYAFYDPRSAQVLAKVLMDLPLSPEGYLIGRHRNSLCRMALCNAAQCLPQFLVRVASDINSLHVPAMSSNEIQTACYRLFDLCVNYKPEKPFFRAIYTLDVMLQDLLPLDLKATAAISVVTLTSAEFRNMITIVARLISESKDKTITLDIGPASTLNVPLVMSIAQKFPIDMAVLFPKETISTQSIDIRFSHMMFAALKACLRSAFLATSPDSTPLFEAFAEMDDIVNM